jgi:hypothetical protein
MMIKQKQLYCSNNKNIAINMKRTLAHFTSYAARERWIFLCTKTV